MPKGIYERQAADLRFETMIDRSGDCHLWIGALASTGYANFWFEGKYIGAHVYAWIRVHGPLGKGQVVRHGPCHTRHCVRLDHLMVGTKGDNNRDRVRDGTQRHVLTEDQISQARVLRLSGARWTDIAQDLGANASSLRKASLRPRGIFGHLNDGTYIPVRPARALTDGQVLEAQRLHAIGVPWTRIARDLGVKPGTIRDAATHRRGVWKHVL